MTDIAAQERESQLRKMERIAIHEAQQAAKVRECLEKWGELK
jgi:hypothetical protein